MLGFVLKELFDREGDVEGDARKPQITVSFAFLIRVGPVSSWSSQQLVPPILGDAGATRASYK